MTDKLLFFYVTIHKIIVQTKNKLFIIIGLWFGRVEFDDGLYPSGTGSIPRVKSNISNSMIHLNANHSLKFVAVVVYKKSFTFNFV